MAILALFCLGRGLKTVAIGIASYDRVGFRRAGAMYLLGLSIMALPLVFAG